MSLPQERIIDCKKLAKEILLKLEQESLALRNKNKIPCFASVMVGENPESLIYVNHKLNKAKELSIESKLYKMDNNITEENLLKCITQLNTDNKIHGIFLQLPLPQNISRKKIIASIAPNKDIDGLHMINVGALSFENNKGILAQQSKFQGFVPCTALGVMCILHKLGVNLSGTDVVIVGKSELVGRPLSTLLLNNDSTVTITHSKTKNLEDICKRADIIVCAAGSPKLINSKFIGNKSIVIDVGITRDPNTNKIIGDVDIKDVLNKVSYISKVPGGVGLLTVTCLMYNIIKATKLNS